MQIIAIKSLFSIYFLIMKKHNEYIQLDMAQIMEELELGETIEISEAYLHWLDSQITDTCHHSLGFRGMYASLAVIIVICIMLYYFIHGKKAASSMKEAA